MTDMFDAWLEREGDEDFRPNDANNCKDEAFGYMRDPAWRAANPQLPWFVFEEPTPANAVAVQYLDEIRSNDRHPIRRTIRALTFPGVTVEDERAVLANYVLYLFCIAIHDYMPYLWTGLQEVDLLMQGFGVLHGQILHIEWNPFADEYYETARGIIEDTFNISTRRRTTRYAGTLLAEEPPECLLRLPREDDYLEAAALRHRLADADNITGYGKLLCGNECRWIRRWLALYDKMQVDERRRLAVQMAWHGRLGQSSALGALPLDMLQQLSSEL